MLFPWLRLLKPPKDTLEILLYNDFFGTPLADQLRTGSSPHVFLEDRSCLSRADAVVFHLPGLRDASRLPRKRHGQIWVAFTCESDLNYPHQSDPGLMRLFDVTMTYHQDSHVPINYVWPGKIGEYLAPPPPKTETATAAIFISNGVPRSDRDDYLRELARWIPIDRYGRHQPNRQLEEDLGRETLIRTLGRYKFALAFENSIDPDYVTEKFFNPFVAGAVPVYRGAPNVAGFSPGDKAFIDTADFASPRELAGYLLHLCAHEAEYMEFHSWRRRPLRAGFLKLYEQAWTSPMRRLDVALQKHRRV